ncbi:MAG: hypothetical protein KDA41_00710, partial [Planctomycetales bacterium]|nr:hypothetical protein [Planctomycetales bacterium]
MRRSLRRRKGNVLVLSAVLMVMMVAMLAFAVDVGYIYVSRTQLQRSADAAAMAAAWELIDEDAIYGTSSTANVESNARAKAGEYAGYNYVLAANPSL